MKPATGPGFLATLLNLQRPLIFLDVETTTPEGESQPDPKVDRIVELGVTKIYPDGRATRFSTFMDPGQRMNPEASKVNGITDDMLVGARTFQSWARSILAAIGDSDFAGFNAARYDKRVLQAEFARVGIEWDPDAVEWVDLYLLWAAMEPRDLAAWVRRCGGEAQPGHRAADDVDVLVDLLPAFLDLFPALPRTVNELAALTKRPKDPTWIDPDGKFRWVAGVALVCFGKYDGKPLTEIPKDYWRYVIDKDFSPEVKAVAKGAINGIYPTRNDDTGATVIPGAEPTLFPMAAADNH